MSLTWSCLLLPYPCPMMLDPRVPEECNEMSGEGNRREKNCSHETRADSSSSPAPPNNLVVYLLTHSCFQCRKLQVDEE